MTIFNFENVWKKFRGLIKNLFNVSTAQSYEFYVLKNTPSKSFPFWRKQYSNLNRILAKTRSQSAGDMCWISRRIFSMRSCIVLGELLWTGDLRKPYKKKVQEIRSGDLAGQGMSPNLLNTFAEKIVRHFVHRRSDCMSSSSILLKMCSIVVTMEISEGRREKAVYQFTISLWSYCLTVFIKNRPIMALIKIAHQSGVLGFL